MVYPNSYNKKCSTCSTFMPSGVGFAFKLNGSTRYTNCCENQSCIERYPQVIQDKINAIKNPDQVEGVKSISTSGVITMPFDRKALPLIKSLPNARWNPTDKVWSCSVERQNLKRVMEVCNQIGISYPSIWDSTSSQKSDLTMQALQRAKGVAYPYQMEGIEFLTSKSHALLADDMGLGKTIQSIMSIPSNSCTIVVCPATLKLNWSNEVKKWRDDLEPIVCKGRDGFVFPQVNQVVIINYDILPKFLTPTSKYDKDGSLSQNQKEILNQCTLIADESHLCKSFKATRSKRMKVLANHCARVWSMTGTPLLNKGFDLFGVLDTFGMSYEVFGGFKGFLRDMNAYENPYGGYDFGTPKDCVVEKMKRVMLRRTKGEVLTDLPSKTYQDIIVDLDSKLITYLDKLATQHNFSSTSGELPMFTQMSSVRARLAKSKTDTMLSLVESFEESNEAVVVFSAHRHPIESLENREGWEIILGDTPNTKRQDIVERFQNGELKGIGCSIKAGGVGITLTHASKMIFVDLEWNPSLNSQAEDRICRIGQKASSLQYIRLIGNHVLDAHVLKLLDEKSSQIRKAIEESYNYEKSQIETREERDARIAKINKKYSENVVYGKVSSDKIKPKFETVTLTQSLVEKINESLAFLCGVCDYASDKDKLGFNAGHAYMMHHVFQSGLCASDETVQRYVLSVLETYKNTQLKSHSFSPFPLK